MGASRNKGNQHARKYFTEEERREARRRSALEWYHRNKDLKGRRRASGKVRLDKSNQQV